MDKQENNNCIFPVNKIYKTEGKPINGHQEKRKREAQQLYSGFFYQSVYMFWVNVSMRIKRIRYVRKTAAKGSNIFTGKWHILADTIELLRRLQTQVHTGILLSKPGLLFTAG